MLSNPLPTLVELTRGPLVESVHAGAIAVVDAQGKLVASAGDPDLIANLRSASKPFQALPLVESGGADAFHLSDREISITCASHAGTDDHVAVLRAMQARIGIRESDLQCGVHPPMDDATERAMLLRGEAPLPTGTTARGNIPGCWRSAFMAGTRSKITSTLNTPSSRTSCMYLRMWPG